MVLLRRAKEKEMTLILKDQSLSRVLLSKVLQQQLLNCLHFAASGGISFATINLYGCLAVEGPCTRSRGWLLKQSPKQKSRELVETFKPKAAGNKAVGPK